MLKVVYMKTAQNHRPAFGIIGGGFSGIALAVNLINRASFPLDITLIDSATSFGKGVAFATQNPQHPLNVRALHMGLLPETPDDFYHWLKANPQRWKALDPSFQGLDFSPQSYVPRMIYGLYLEDLFNDAQTKAKQKGIRLTVIQAQAQDVNLLSSDLLEIVLSTGSSISVDRLILATGVSPCKKLPFEHPHLLNDRRYTTNVWDPHPESILRNMPMPQDEIIIIGTGLTMADVVATLIDRGFRGNILAVSPSGSVAQPHLAALPVKMPLVNIAKYAMTLLNLFKGFRQELDRTTQEGYDWRSLIDTLRPSLPKLWQGLTVVEKKQFLRHLYSLWNKHRHRLPPESAALLMHLQEEKKLHIIAGHVEEIDNSHPERLQVRIRIKDKAASQRIEVGHAINCCGPEYRLTKQPNVLLQNLLNKELIRPDALDLGIALSPEGWVQGKAPERIYTLGALLFGERFETTSVPEIREQAAEIAERLLQLNAEPQS